MKNLKLLTLLVLGILIVSCSSSSSKKESIVKDEPVLSYFEEYLFEKDKHIFTFSNSSQKNKDRTEVLFVQKWNSPSFLPNGKWDGIAWDGNIFYGSTVEDSIYFDYTYYAHSRHYINMTKDSIAIIEKSFHKNAVTNDPRNTCWWLSTLSNYEKFASLSEFLREATVAREKTEFDDYLNDLEKKINLMEGKSEYEKVIAFTAMKVPGDPITWNAWESPGYYKPRL